MRKNLIIVLLFIPLAFKGHSQVNTKPDVPLFDYLTINPTTGNPTLFWTPPPLYPPTVRPNPVGFIIYKITNGIRNAIDTVNNTTYSYTDLNSNGNQERLMYTIASAGPTEPSELSIDHWSIFVESDYDSCNHSINLKWNLYNGNYNSRRVGWLASTISTYYYVYVGNDLNWQSFLLKDSADRFDGKYTLRDVDENKDYYAYVTAKRSDTSFTTISNLHHIYTKMAQHPSYIRVDSIIAQDNGNKIFFHIDPATELSRFKVVRWELPDTNRSIFSAKDTLYRFRDKGLLSYFDQSDNWASRTRPFHYKIDAMNGCILLAIPEKNDTLFKVVSVSNLPNTLITKVYAKKKNNEVVWTPFIDTYRPSYRNNSIRYLVTRFVSLNGTIDSAIIHDTLITDPFNLYKRDERFNYIDPLNVERSTKHVDDITGFEWHGYSQEFCYMVEAIENNSNGDQVMYSRSRKICSEVVPGVVMPDAIMPNSDKVVNGHARNLFVPNINFESNYTLYIYNRWGELIYEGKNQGWNGKLASGEFVKEGAYVYRLIIHTLGNRDVIKVGNVTVVY